MHYWALIPGTHVGVLFPGEHRTSGGKTSSIWAALLLFYFFLPNICSLFLASVSKNTKNPHVRNRDVMDFATQQVQSLHEKVGGSHHILHKPHHELNTNKPPSPASLFRRQAF